jgi:hypothetical protein
MIGLQEGYDIFCEAPVGEGAAMRTILVEDKASVRDPPDGPQEQLGRVKAVAAPANDERRRRDLAEPFTAVEGVFGHDGRDHVGGVPLALD